MDRRAMIGSGERAWLLRAWLVWAMAVAGVGLAACSDDDDETARSAVLEINLRSQVELVHASPQTSSFSLYKARIRHLQAFRRLRPT